MNSPELGELGQGQGLGEEGENITHTHRTGNGYF